MSQPDFTVEYLDPKTLLENPHQFRRHPDSQKSALSASVKEFGWVDGPLLNKRTGNLIDGHLRRDEAIAQGRATIPVKVVDLSEADERRLIRMFDPLTGMALTDDAALASLIAAIDDPEIERLLASVETPSGLLPGVDPDEIPAEVETRCKAGDLWRLGEHFLLCGDSTKGEDVARLMEGETADACLTDPPYGLASDGKVQKRGERIEVFGIAWDQEAPLGWISAAANALAEGAALLSFWATAGITDLWRALEAGGVHPLHTVYWRKTTCPQPRPNFCSSIEAAVFGRKPGKVLCWNGGGATPNVFDAVRSGGNERTEHEAQKPMALWLPLIETVTDPGHVLYDPFAGSGTTLIACEQTGRVARCIEIEPRYVDICLARYEQATGQTATLA